MLRRYAFYSHPLLIGLFVAAALMLMGVPEATAQNFTVEGTVTESETGNTLPGVNIVEVGTQQGTTTGADGSYEITVSGEDARLRFSFVGYQPKTISVDGRSEINVELQTQAQEMESVVVTALGIERQRRSVGYATSEVGEADLVEATEANPAELLQGNVPGVVVNTNAGGVASSSTVNIRGLSNLTGDNEPLYIVDGTPILSSTIGSAGRYGGFDGGTVLSIVSPSNIKNISVLKGAGAAALYGTRARDGVILIETKTGTGGAGQDGFSVNYSTTLTSRRPLSGFTDYQTEYGQGTLGLPPDDQASAREAGLNSWGARLGSVDQSVQFDGEARPYQDVLNREGFYRNGLSQKHSLTLNRGSENTSLRVSGSYLNSASIVPSSGYEQINTSVRGNAQLGDLNVDANVTYQNEATNDRTYLNDAPRNPNFLISFLPSNVPKSALKPGYTEDGTELVFSDPFQTNPYFAVNKFEADDTRDRILASTKLNFEINDWISIQGRQGLDWSNLRRTTVDPFGTAFKPEGSMYEREYSRWESNTKMLLSGTPQLTDNLSLRLDVGGNLRMNQFELIGVRGQGFNVRDLQTISNTGSPERVYDFSEQEVRSVFGSAAFSYNDYAYLTVTSRNDWSSTLPQENNSFFYPSVSGSFVFSDVLPVPDWMSFGKVRASWAEIGADTDPYQLFLTYSLIGEHQGQPLGTISQIDVPNFSLVPTNTRETEFGLETQFLNDRLGLDLSYYRRSTNNQITSQGVSPTSGFGGRILNSGEVRNSGVEAVLTATPVANDEVSWDTRVNFAANRSEIVSLAQELRTDAVSRSATVSIVQKVGSPVSTIYGTPYVRDDQGRIVHGENGLPLQGEQEVLGKGAPDWTLGFSNTVSFKNVYVNALLDVKWGGVMYSGTNRSAYAYGLHKETLEGRAACDEVKTEDGYPTDGCFRPEGVSGHVEETDDGERNVVVDSTTTATVLPGEYYGYISSSIAEQFIYDANYINLRQVRVGYELPNTWLNQTPLERVRVSLVGRNLFYLFDSVPNVNPGAEYNSASTPGLEYASVPQTRNFGFDLSVTF
jgi:TonB-linked SusC/RagA family outer membrane protein